jgi:hypothetical protein
MVVGTAHSDSKETLPADRARGPLYESGDCWDLETVIPWTVSDVDAYDDINILQVALGRRLSPCTPAAHDGASRPQVRQNVV